MSWPQWFAVDSPPYTVGGPVSNTVNQHAIELTYFPVSLIWFSTRNGAESWAKAKGGGGSAGVGGTGGINKAINTATSPVAAAGSAVSSAADFLSRLSQPHTWLRIGEGFLGLLLILVGADKLLGSPRATQAVLRTMML